MGQPIECIWAIRAFMGVSMSAPMAVEFYGDIAN